MRGAALPLLILALLLTGCAEPVGPPDAQADMRRSDDDRICFPWIHEWEEYVVAPAGGSDGRRWDVELVVDTLHFRDHAIVCVERPRWVAVDR